MKKIILLALIAIAHNASAQMQIKLKEYTASNGKTYKIGDVIKLNKGSGPYGEFVYVTVGGWAVSANPEDNRLGAGNSGLEVTIKKIRKGNTKRYKVVNFTVGGGNLTNYVMNIEGAIESCEIENCKTNKENPDPVPDKYSKLRELKKLLDDGIINQSEFEAEKAKILE
jgi:hypothetical protein